MLIRYKISRDGKPVKQAEIFTQEEHGIKLFQLDGDAIKIIRRLQGAGHESYIVGGAVRDILLKKHPKDFDIATGAEPAQIRKLFRNSRIIGRRFRLVHIFFHNGKIIEVSTFRSGNGNSFGDIDDDALRRDFSMNALYYDPIQEQLLDFVHGFEDLREGRLRAIIPLKKIFVEDPVRIIRAIKYMIKTDLKPDFFLRQRIRRHSPLLKDIPHSRITEEIYKILGSDYASPIFAELFDFTVMSHILPQLDTLIRDDEAAARRFFENLATLDSKRKTTRAELIHYLVRDYVLNLAPWSGKKRLNFSELYSGIKTIVKPMVPANKDVEGAMTALLAERGQREINRPRRRRRSRKTRP